MSQERPIDPRRRHLFRMMAASGAMIPLAAVSRAHAAPGAAGGLNSGRRDANPGAGRHHCLLSGTLVSTDLGAVPVERLRVGDLVLTEPGALQPIQGIGRNVFVRDRDAAWDETVAPVCIQQSAIGPCVPARDLFLSAEHALFIDGYLIPVKHLVNGLTITQDLTILDTVEYIHLAFARHEVFYAEGTAVESLLVSDADKAADRFAQYDGSSFMGPMVPYAPLLGYFGGRQEAIALARLAVHPWIDVRDRVQVVYDRLVARAQDLRANARQTANAA